MLAVPEDYARQPSLGDGSHERGKDLHMSVRIAKALAVSVVVALSALASAPARPAFTVDPGTVIGIDPTGFALREYSFTGTLMDTLELQLGGTLASGLAVIGNRVFVSTDGGQIGEVNLTTGALQNVFSVAAASGQTVELGDDGTNLLAYTINGIVSKYTSGGTLLGTISLDAGSNRGTNGQGIDGSPTRIFLERIDNINVFDSAGTFITTIVTDPQAAGASSLGYNQGDDTLWLATSQDQKVRQYSMAGVLLSSFDDILPGTFVGLDVVAGGTSGAASEPGTLLLLGLGAFALVASGRRGVRRA